VGFLEIFKRNDAVRDRKFNLIYQTYRVLMYRVAYSILGNEFDAEGAVQQAFLAIFKNLDKISEIGCPKTRSFIVIIVERKATDILRNKYRNQHLELDEEIVGMSIPLPGDCGLADVMSRMPARYREILLLRSDNGLTVNEIAQILESTPTAIQRALTRAKDALRKELEKEDAMF
jgi:RNA polymerase sigma-70 factor (ECF subfamily)